MRVPQERDPHGLDTHSPGAKLDAGKVPVESLLLAYFPRALLAVARVSQHGAEKYAPDGWKHVEDGVQRYRDARGRHILQQHVEGSMDGSGELHEAHIAWNALAVLELMLRQAEAENEKPPL